MPIGRSPQQSSRRASTTVQAQKRASTSTSPNLISFSQPTRAENDNKLAKCPKCKKSVAGNHSALQCHKCENWLHTKCIDKSISSDFYDKISKIDSIVLLCECCRSVPEFVPEFVLPETTSSLPQTDETTPCNSIPNSTQTDPPTSTQTDQPTAAQSTSTPCDSNVRIVKGHDDPLSNFYPFDFTYEGVKFKSAEHAYLYSRATSQENAVLASRIHVSKNAFEAKQLSKQLKSSPNKDDDVDLMRTILLAKLHNCFTFRQSLRNSTGKRLAHSTYPSDTFWGTGLHFMDVRGANGKSFPGKTVWG